MNSHTDEPEEPDERLEPWLEAALDDVEEPRARGSFRDELRARFVVNAASEESPKGGPATEIDVPIRVPAPRRSRHKRAELRATPKRSTAGWWTAAALAAAAAVAVFLMLSRSPGARVLLVESDVANLKLDGNTVTSESELARGLHVGSLLESSDQTVRLRLDGVVLIELAPRTRLAFAAWSDAPDGETAFELRAGGVRVLTGPSFASRKLRVQAPDAEIAVVGTEFGVDIIDGMGTCVCCTRGVIDVAPRGQTTTNRVLEGGMAFCFSSGEAPMLGDVKSEHAADVTKLRRFW